MKLNLRLFLFAFIVFIIFLAAPQFSGVTQGEMTLLTVATVGNETYGGTADLELIIRPGSGNVYLATFPFSKLDTQISTRFANEIACSMVDVDCDRYDFFYSITADSTIIGGPSAGASLAALTVALLDNQPILDDVAITGTISAGGIVGPVGGIREKIAAAANDGMTTVIIPRWEEELAANVSYDNGTNSTNVSYPENITIIEVGNLGDVLQALTGKRYLEPVESLVVPPAYNYIMEEVAVQLCNRSEVLLADLSSDVYDHALFNASRQFLAEAVNASAKGMFYSQASYCFSANLRLRELQLDNFTPERIQELRRDVQMAIALSMRKLDERKLVTFTDLQTRAIVDERLREAADYLDEENVSARDVAYAMERYRSGIIWSNFFELPGERLQLDDIHLKRACEAKLSEVEERKGYLSFLFGSPIIDEQELDAAYAMYADGDYALCLFKASKAKAQVDMIISSIAMSESDLPALVSEKLAIAEVIIHRETTNDRFPIMGYSYYEYAGSLQEDDSYVAALFASYALELADLSLYFSPPPGIFALAFSVFTDPFIIGFLAGLFVTFAMLVVVPSKKKKHHKKRARRKP